LINLNYWRKHKISEKVLDCLFHHTFPYHLFDQDALNMVLYDQKLVLPLKYNVLQWVFLWPFNKAFTKKEYEEARTNPVIIHYASSKPWNKYSFHPRKGLYHQYRKLVWLDTITFSKKLEIRHLIMNGIWFLGGYLINMLPKKLHYFLIFKPMQRIIPFHPKKKMPT
jgi:lipopolysaccharide biosynthesis glycosyltransferase